MVSPSVHVGPRRGCPTTTYRISRIPPGPGSSSGARRAIASRPAFTVVSRRDRCPAPAIPTSPDRGADSSRRKPGASCLFAAPDKPAPEAPVIWLQNLSRHVIASNADRIGAPDQLDFDIRHIPFNAHVHIDAHGRQHVILKSSVLHVVLLVSGPLITMAPVRLQFASHGMARLGPHIDALGALAHLLLGRRLAIPADRPGDVDRIKLRDAIIALDGERAGATRRDIATVIHGAGRVAEEWSHPNGRLKAVIKRDVLRGRRMLAGGYRNLVAGGTFAVAA